MAAVPSLHEPASHVLRRIVRAHPGRLSLTGGLVVVENALDLFYPLAAGFAIDAVLAGELRHAWLYVGLILVFWSVGAARRAIDTRVYSRIYAGLATEVITAQQRLGVERSAIHARATLSRQFVDFFEVEVPTLVTALAGIVGSAVMLLVLEPTVGAVAAVVLLVAVLASRPYLARSEFLAACLHARQEREAASIDTARPLRIARHFRITGGRRVALSDLEAKAYVGVGVVTAGLFALAFVHLAGESGTTAGHLYTVTSYLWTFAFGLDDLPQHLAQLGRLRELGTRIRPGLDADDDADED